MKEKETYKYWIDLFYKFLVDEKILFQFLNEIDVPLYEYCFGQSVNHYIWDACNPWSNKWDTLWKVKNGKWLEMVKAKGLVKYREILNKEGNKSNIN